MGAAMWEPEAEARPREALERETVEGMRRTLGHALTNPAWRRRLGSVKPGDIRSAADWARLPFLTKDELRDAYPFGLACAEPERVLRVHMSSGTTGNPVVNPFTRADVEQWAAVMARCYTVAGVGARDDLGQLIEDCASGRELRAMGYGADAVHAAMLDCYDTVPVMRGERFERLHP